jgi:ketosteroid isomerase-like protein
MAPIYIPFQSKTLIVSLLLLLGTFQLSKGQSSVKSEKEIDAVLEKLNMAYQEMDGAKITSFLLKDSLFTSISQGIMYTYEDYEKIKPQDFHPLSRWTKKDIHVFNSKSAVANCNLSSQMKDPDGNPFEVTTIETIVFKKEKGKWLIVVLHSSNITENRNF